MNREGTRAAGASEHAAWAAAASSITVALISFFFLSAFDRQRAALALAAGMLIGAFSGVLALRTLEAGLPFRLASLARLMVQSLLAVGVGWIIGRDLIWMPALGLVVSYVILGSFALRGVLTR